MLKLLFLLFKIIFLNTFYFKLKAMFSIWLKSENFKHICAFDGLMYFICKLSNFLVLLAAYNIYYDYISVQCSSTYLVNNTRREVVSCIWNVPNSRDNDHGMLDTPAKHDCRRPKLCDREQRARTGHDRWG